MTLKTLLLAFLVFSFTSVGVAAEKWVVPKVLCPDFSRSAGRACTDIFTLELGKEVDNPNARKNVEGICLAAEELGGRLCQEGVVKLDRSNVQNFCVDMGASFATITEMGCEKAVEESASANPPEMNEEMLRTCHRVSVNLMDKFQPACVKRFSEKPLPPEKPEPKVRPKAKPGPPPFKTREEALSV